MSEKEKFMGHFERAVERGLVDMKFMVRHGEQLTSEEFFAAANRLEAAIERGETKRIEHWDDIPMTKSHLLAS